MEFSTKNKNEVASFYAGLVASTFHLDVKQELQDCMVRDPELVDEWDKAIKSLSMGETDAWRTQSTHIFNRAEEDLESCIKSAKLRTVGTQLDHWWGSFWSQGDAAIQLIDQRGQDSWLDLKKQALAMRFNWQFKQYYDAGVRLGNFWSIEIGAPKWVDQIDFEEEEDLSTEAYPLSEFYAAYFEEI